MTKSKPSTSPNDPEDPEDGDSEPEGDDSPHETEKDDETFVVIVWFNNMKHKITDVSEDEGIFLFKMRLQGMFNVLSTYIEITPRNHHLENDDYDIDDLKVSDFLNDETFVEFDMQVLPHDVAGCFDLTVVETFGARRSHQVMVVGSNDGEDLRYIVSGSFNMPVSFIKLYSDDLMFDCSLSIIDHGITENSVVHLGICGSGGTQKKRKCTISEMKVRATDPKMIKDIFKVEAFNDEAWLDSLPKDIFGRLLQGLTKDEGLSSTSSSHR